MDTPKISVLVPSYNRKHLIEMCVNSILSQTFQDFEIIIRDDCSTDGVFEFLQTRYAEQISAGKIKLFRNEKNVDEFRSINRMFTDATGKYIKILHNDDLLMPNALQHLYEVAEKFNADVVHESYYYNSPPDGIITEGTKLFPVCSETNPVEEITLMPNDDTFRFKEWANMGTFLDQQYNFFNRKFLLENELFFESVLYVITLRWLMKAKVFVKTPVLVYIRRDSPGSKSRAKFYLEELEKFISGRIKMLRYVEEKIFPDVEFFKNNPAVQNFVKTRLVTFHDNHFFFYSRAYENGLPDEIQEIVEKTFKKYFGDNADLPIIYFNWLRLNQFGHNIEDVMYRKALESLTPPVFREVDLKNIAA